MSKHTPGPWRAIATKRDGTWPIWEIEANGDDLHPIAEVSDKANAHLIAAAPDLLEALEALARSFDAVAYAAWTPEMHAAVAAIAKAKGEP